MANELTNHLISVSNEAELLLQTLMVNYKKSDEKLSEKSKEINQLEWVTLMWIGYTKLDRKDKAKLEKEVFHQR